MSCSDNWGRFAASPACFTAPSSPARSTPVPAGSSPQVWHTPRSQGSAAADGPVMPIGIPVERADGTDRTRRIPEMEVSLPVIVRKALRQAERTPHARNGQISQTNASECPYRGILATQHPLEDAVGRLELPLIVQGQLPDVLLREPVPTSSVRTSTVSPSWNRMITPPSFQTNTLHPLFIVLK